MLATRTQPLMHTEYLQPMDPLPTTLDAKKSPLALLAQTCSSIGKPDPPPSSGEMKTALTAPLDIIGGKKSPEKAATTVSDLDRSSFKPYKQNEKRDGDAHVTKIPSYAKETVQRGSPLSVITSSEAKPMASATTFTSSPPSPVKARTELSRPSSNQSTTETVSSHTSTGHSFGCASSGAHSPSHRGDSKPHSVSSAPVLPTHLVPPALATGFKTSTSLASTPPTSGHCGCPSQLLGHLPHIADPASISKDHAGHLLAATAGSPYATAYARVKTADGGTTLMPICRDPYCSHCQTASLTASSGASCTQCRHDGLTLSGAVPFALPVPGAIPAYFPSGSPTAAATPYLYPPPPVPAQTEHGHVCNWVSGTTSCGKRFGSGEELLQHLRTHTMQSNESSVAAAAAAAAATSPYALAASSLNAQLSAYYMHYPAAAPIPGSFGLTKPGVPPSPLSPGAALRYHPYKSPVPTSLATFPGLPAGAYYSPYAFHDLKGRLAAAGVPH